MIIETFEAGPVATNGYLVADKLQGVAAVIDAPQGAASLIVEQARKWNTPIAFLLNTHAHWDHILDNAELLRLTAAKFGIHRESAPLLSLPQARYFGLDLDIEPSHPDFFLEEGKPLDVGSLQFEILHCPGHCPGSVVLFERKERTAFVGDVLFAGSVGRADLPGGNYEVLMRSICEKLLPLGDNVRVFPGHGPVTTIGNERLTNPFLAAARESNP
jgi:glyoxylase-like metal-dependent hydrolase (beta-lactamase superfamily II)